jgi:hypothetical protein
MITTEDRERQRRQINENYDVFVRQLGDLLPLHRDKYALMRDGKIIGIFDNPGEANRIGIEMFADEFFSIQEVTDEPIDLGFWSHVAVH